MSDTTAAIQLTDVRFHYGKGPEILRIPEFRVEKGEKVFLFGPSGSGKTTLLGVLACVLGGYTGSVEVLGRDISKMSGSQRDAFRGSHLGYIFQLFNLIPYLSVLENVTLPCRLQPLQARIQRPPALPTTGPSANSTRSICGIFF